MAKETGREYEKDKSQSGRQIFPTCNPISNQGREQNRQPSANRVDRMPDLHDVFNPEPLAQRVCEIVDYLPVKRQIVLRCKHGRRGIFSKRSIEIIDMGGLRIVNLLVARHPGIETAPNHQGKCRQSKEIKNKFELVFSETFHPLHQPCFHIHNSL